MAVVRPAKHSLPPLCLRNHTTLLAPDPMANKFISLQLSNYNILCFPEEPTGCILYITPIASDKANKLYVLKIWKYKWHSSPLVVFVSMRIDNVSDKTVVMPPICCSCVNCHTNQVILITLSFLQISTIFFKT